MTLRSVRATVDERHGPLPGDDLIPAPIGTLTHAITLQCTPRELWPWLVQMGAGRAGWYSYDRLDNGGVPSADYIVPALQQIAVGDLFPGLPGERDAFVVLQFVPERVLVLGAGPDAPARPLVTWAFVLNAASPDTTRLVVRVRAGEGYGMWGMPKAITLRLARAIHYVMERRQLHGLVSRAERRAHMPAPAVLDTFMPRYDVRERHALVVHAPASLVMDTARTIDIQGIPLVHGIFWLRETLLGSTPPPPRRPVGFVEETLALGHAPLAEAPGRFFIAGTSCQPWKADVVFSPVPADGFAAYAEPDRVKIAWTLETEPLGPTTTRLASETRAVATDEAARRRFLRYWRLASFGIVLIRLLLLPAVRREAEHRWRAEQAKAA